MNDKNASMLFSSSVQAISSKKSKATIVIDLIVSEGPIIDLVEIQKQAFEEGLWRIEEFRNPKPEAV